MAALFSVNATRRGTSVAHAGAHIGMEAQE